jgi:hypothetical protein
MQDSVSNSNEIFENKLNLARVKADQLKQNVQLSTNYSLSERCDKIRNQIDLHVETLIQQTNEARQDLLAEVDEYRDQIQADHKKRDTTIKESLVEISNSLSLLNVNSTDSSNTQTVVDETLSQIIRLESLFKAILFDHKLFNYNKKAAKFDKHTIGEIRCDNVSAKFDIKPSDFNFKKPKKLDLMHVTFRSKLKQLESGRFVHTQNNSKINFSMFILTNDAKSIKFERTVYPNLLVYENFIEVYKNRLFVYLELYDGDEDSRRRRRDTFENYLLVLDDNLNILSERSSTSFNYEIRKIALNSSFIFCMSDKDEIHIFDWSLNDITKDAMASLKLNLESIEYFNQIKLCEKYLYVSYKHEDNDSNFFLRVVDLKNGSVLSDFQLDSKCHEFDIFDQRTLVIFQYLGPSFIFYDWITGKVEYETHMEMNLSRNPLILINANTDAILFYDFLVRKLYKISVDVQLQL